MLAWGCVLAALSLLAASSVPINPALGEEGAVAGAAGRRDSPVSNTGFPGGEYRDPHIPEWEGARLLLQLLAGVKCTRLPPDRSLWKRVPSGGSQAGQLYQRLPTLKERDQLLDQAGPSLPGGVLNQS